MRIFIAGFPQETNTFSTMLTGLKQFLVLRDKDDIKRLEPYSSWYEKAVNSEYQFICSLDASAQPAGPVSGVS